MAKLTPVEGNPFEAAKEAQLTPVEGNPFEPQPQAPAEAPATEVPGYQRAGQVAGAVADTALEGMAGFNRGLTRLADFLTTDQVNAVAEILGPEWLGITDKQHSVPSITDTAAAGTQGNFMDQGLARDVVRGASEVVPAALAGGAALSQTAARLPASLPGNASRAAAKAAGGRTAAAPVVAPAESMTAGAVRQIAPAAPAADAAYGAASGAGAEVGRDMGGETGALAGAVAAPLGIATFKSLLSGAFNMGRAAVEKLTRSAGDMGEEGMAKLLSEAMERTGVTPDEAARRLAELGPDAVPADVGDGFMRLMRLAISKRPRIGGESHRVLDPRHAAQGDRIAAAFDDAGMMPDASLDDVIARLQQKLGPKIDDLYGAARAKSEAVLGGPRPSSGYSAGSPHLKPKRTKLEQLLDGENIGGSATKQAELELKAKRLSGEPVTKLDRIDATKRALDDQIKSAIRDGKMSKARSYLKLKNQLVTEADKAIPEYKEARNLFAGKAEMESAAELGQEFFKMDARDLVGTVKTMGQSERMMFRMGAREALLRKLDGMQVSRDSVKALFGRGGDVKKLKAVFPDQKSFNKFADALEREAHFVMTRRAAQANSTTFQQFSDGQSFQEAMEGAMAITGDPAAAASWLGKALSKLTGDRSSEAFTKALEEVGDVLLYRGMDPQRLQTLLRNGSREQIAKELRKALPKAKSAAWRTSAGSGAGEIRSRPQALPN